jgi:hypothetical protein
MRAVDTAPAPARILPMVATEPIVNLWTRTFAYRRKAAETLQGTRYRVARSRRALASDYRMRGGSDGAETGAAKGIIFGQLAEVHADRIVIGDRTFYFFDGLACPLPVGASVVVEYIEREGRREARRIMGKDDGADIGRPS